MAIQFPQAQVEQLLGARGPALLLTSQHEVFDQRVAHRCRELAAQCGRGWPSETLYAQGLSVALLAAGIDGLDARSDNATRLTRAQRRRVEDCIEADLSVPQTIDRLSFVAGLSQSHFSAAFRRYTGTSPASFRRR